MFGEKELHRSRCLRLVVTGATGYIGSYFINLASNHGHEIIAASRKKPSSCVSSWLPFDLASDRSILLPLGTAAVVHLAANTTPTDELDEESEVVAAQRLMKSAQDVGARFIFVSSQTAQADAPTAYGRIKWRIEQNVLSAGGWIVRPGQVYGGELRGLFGVLVNTVHRFPMLPAFVPSPKIQPIHVDDLTQGLMCITEGLDLPSGVYCLAASKPISFSRFLASIAQSRLRCKCLWVPVPIAIINAIMTALSKAQRTRLGLDRLQSLFNLPVMETQTDLNRLGLQLRPINSGMHPSGSARRRGLLREGWALLSFVLKAAPSSTLLRRYTRGIEQLRDGQSLGLKSTVLANPMLLSLFRASDWPDMNSGKEFTWRLDAATVLAEATQSGAHKFLGLGYEGGRLRCFLSMSTACACELFWRTLRVPMYPFIQLTLRHEKVVL